MATISGIEGLLAGRTLVNRYLVEEVIGRGGMGAVYRARDRQLGREVAVKVITVAAPDRLAHERLRSRFQREARAAAALHHPCVVSVYDCGTDPELCLDFFVMELLRGEDLATRLERAGPPAPATALSILEQAARGLAAGHRAGLIHRDVKPGNIFVERGDRAGEVRVKILDFGIAELTSAEGDTVTHLTVAGRSPYSPAFASPEQLRGESRLTPATDVFSLGAVGFQLLTGRRPFTTPEPRQLRVEVSRSFSLERERLRSIDPDLPAVLERALADSPLERFRDGAALAEALGTVTPGAAAPRVAPPPREPAARPTDEGTRLFAGSGSPLAEPAPADHTLLDPRPPRTLSHAAFAGLPPAPTPTAPAPGIAGEPSAQAPPLPGRRARTRAWIRRASATAWSFLLTAAATGAFAGFWLLAFMGIEAGELEMVYVGTVGATIATPIALHRLMGRRGVIGLGIFASVAATLACTYWLHDQPMELVLGAVFALQLVVCVLTERVTAGRHGESLVTTSAHPDRSDSHLR